MKAMLNAKERDVNDWRALFEAADSRFCYKAMKTPIGSKMSFFEFIWMDPERAVSAQHE